MIDEQLLRDYLANDRFANLIGITLETVEEGHAVAKLEIKEHHLNGADIVQGGVLFTLADLAFAAASNSAGRVAVGINSSISFLKPGNGEFLTAEAHMISMGKTIANGEVDIRNDQNKLVAKLTATAYRKEQQIEQV